MKNMLANWKRNVGGLLVLFLIILSACKESVLNSKSQDSFIGTWEHTEYLISPGSLGTWTDVDIENVYSITFESDGRFSFSGRNDCNEGEFSFDKDTNEIFFHCDQGDDEISYWYNFERESNSDLLILGVKGCTEPCLLKFVLTDK